METLFRDEAFEAKTRLEIEAAQKALQALLTAWNELDIAPCDNLLMLLTQAERYHSEMVHKHTEVPETFGKYAIRKDVYLTLLDVPCPNSLFITARAAKKLPLAGMKELWRISEDGKHIELVEDAATKLIQSNNITVETTNQKKFVEACQKYAEVSSYLHDILKTLPGLHMSFGTPFVIIERSAFGIGKVEIEPTQLREILKHYR